MTSEDVIQQVKGTTECCICVSVYVDPRVLPCMHTFCLRCLEKMTESSNIKPGDKMSCPVCRNQFRLPSNGLPGLPRNFFIENLIGILSVSGTFCSVCGESTKDGKEKPYATIFCINCGENYCEDCCNVHQSLKPFRNHETVAIGSQTHREILSEMTTETCQRCTEHTEEKVQFFCLDCRLVICRLCLSENHQDHRCFHAMKAAVELGRDIERETERLCPCGGSRILPVEELERESLTFLDDILAVEKSIMDRNAELKELIDVHTVALLEKLNSIKAKKLEDVKNKKEKIREYVKIIRSCQTDFKLSALDFCSIAIDLEAKLKVVLSLQDENKSSHEKCNLKKKRKIEDILPQNANIVGEIEEFQICRKHRLELKDGLLFGVTSLNDNIYILSRSPHAVLVFGGDSPFLQIDEIKIDELQEPNDLAGCGKAQCLYVLDSGSNSVFKVPLSIGKLTCWLVADGHLKTFSVTKDGHVVMLRNKQHSWLTVYEANATVIYDILLEDEFSPGMHAVRMQNGNFAVSYGTALQSGVVELTSEGQMVNRFDFDNSKNRLKYPCHLTPISENWLLILDFYNNRILLIDLYLGVMQTLLTKDQNDLMCPWRVCYNEKDHQVLVVHSNGKITAGRKRVDVFSLESFVRH